MFLLGSFLTVLQWIGYVLVAILCLMLMIIVHEFGHFIAGKLFKFKINEFSIGFGPKIFSKTNKNTGEVFSVRCLPLGGFCAFAGEDEKELKEGDFNSKPVWQRIIVLFNGAFFNLIFSMVLVSIFFMSFGDFNPTIIKTSEMVSSDYVQQFQEGDRILSVNGITCTGLLDAKGMPSELLSANNSNVVVVERNKEKITLEVQKDEYYVLDEDGNLTDEIAIGYGIQMTYYVKDGFFDAIWKGIKFPFKIAYITFKSIGQLFTGSAKVSESLGGTATIVQTIASSVSYGFRSVMYVVCVISASIGIMNLLPLPALDGSRIVFCIIEGIFRKPVNKKVEGIIHAVGLVILFGLAIVFDLLHFFA